MTADTALGMIGAELLKLRKKRSLVGFSLLLTVGVVSALYTWVGIGQTAGGLHNFESAMRVIGAEFGLLAAVLIAVEAGAGDIASGVFRDLVVTGRSRLALFLVRIPGALLLCVPIILSAFLLSLAVTFLLADNLPVPGAGLVLEYAAWVLGSVMVVAVVSVGIASMLGSRVAALAGLLGWLAVASPLLAAAPPLGVAREALPTVALEHFKPGDPGTDSVATSTPTALIVLTIWCVAACALGAWRTSTRDA
jgi:hypothetical protein